MDPTDLRVEWLVLASCSAYRARADMYSCFSRWQGMMSLGVVGRARAMPVSLTRYQFWSQADAGPVRWNDSPGLMTASELGARCGRRRASRRPMYTISRVSTRSTLDGVPATSRCTRSRPTKVEIARSQDPVTATRSRSLTPTSKPPEMADPYRYSPTRSSPSSPRRLLGHEPNDRTDRGIHRPRVFSQAAMVKLLGPA